MSSRCFNIQIDSVSLTVSRVHLDGDYIGHAQLFTTARRPKVWFCTDADSTLLDLGPFTSADEAAFALVRHVDGERIRDRIVAKFGPTP